MSTEVTATDTVTGKSKTCVIENDFVVVVDGNKYIGHVQHFPKTGTTQLTIRTRKPEESEA